MADKPLKILSSIPDAVDAVAVELGSKQSLIDPLAKLVSITNFGVEMEATRASGVKELMGSLLSKQGNVSNRAFATITIADNTFDVGDNITITGLNGIPLVIDPGIDFTVGVDASATAANLATLLDGLWEYLGATSLGAVVTLQARYPGTIFHGVTLSENDGVTDNFILSGGTLAGGVDPAIATITVNDGTLNAGDSLTVTDLNDNLFTITQGSEISGGGTANDLAEEIAFAFNNLTGFLDIIYAINVLNVVTLIALNVGSEWNDLTLSEVDGATDNFTLSGPNFTGGEDVNAFILDTSDDLSVPGAKLLTIKNFGTPVFSIDKSGVLNLFGNNIDNLGVIDTTGLTVDSEDEIRLETQNAGNTRNTYLSLKSQASVNTIDIKTISLTTTDLVQLIGQLNPGSNTTAQFRTVDNNGNQAAFNLQSAENSNGTFAQMVSTGNFGTNTLRIGDNGGDNGMVVNSTGTISLMSVSGGVTHQLTMNSAANNGMVYNSGVANSGSNIAHLFDTQNSLTGSTKIAAWRKAGGSNLMSLDGFGNLTVFSWIGDTSIAPSILSTVANSALARGLVINTSNSFTTAGATLLLIRNQGAAKFTLDKDGNILTEAGRFTGNVANGASAVGIKLDTTNALTIDGSKVLSVLNQTTEYMNLRRGTDVSGFYTDSVLLDFKNKDGTLMMQLGASDDGTTVNQYINESVDTFQIFHTTDFDSGAGAKAAGYFSTMSGTAPEAHVQTFKIGSSFVDLVVGGGTDGDQFSLGVTRSTGSAGTTNLKIQGTDLTAVGKTNLRYFLQLGETSNEAYLGLTADGKFIGANKNTSPTAWRFESGAADSASAIGYELDTLNPLANAAAYLMMVKNQGSRKFSINKDGQTVIGGAPGYTPQAGVGLVVNTAITNIGDGTSNVGLEFKSGNAGGYISDGSLFWLNFQKTAGAGRNQVLFPVVQTFDNNVGVIHTSQTNGNAGQGSPGLTVNSLNTLSTLGDRLISLKNNMSEKFYVEYDGSFVWNDSINAILNNVVDSDQEFATGIVTIINNTFDAGDKITITFPGAGAFDFEESVDWTAGVDTDASAQNLADAINFNTPEVYTRVFADVVGSVITIRALWGGRRGNRIQITETDGATNNFTLTGLDGTGHMTGGTNIGMGIIIDTDESLAQSDERRILSVRNNLREVLGIEPTGSIFSGNHYSSQPTELYFRNPAPNNIRSEGNLSIILNNGGNADIQFLVQGSSGQFIQFQTDFPTLFKSQQGDNGAQTAFQLDTFEELTNANSIHTEFLNQGNTIAKVRIDGTLDLSDGSSGMIQGLSDDTGVTLASAVVDVTKTLLNVYNINGADNKFSIGHNGGFNVKRRAVATSANTAGEFILGVTDTSASRTITIDTDDEVEGRILIIKDESGAAGTNNITVATEGASTIDGAASITISVNYGVAKLYFNGTNWFTF